jgi:hypothetical protein
MPAQNKTKEYAVEMAMSALKYAICVPALAVAVAFVAPANAAHGGHAGHGGGHVGNGHTFGGHGHGHGHGGFGGVFFGGGVFYAGGPWFWSDYDTWPFNEDYLTPPESAPMYIEQDEAPDQPANTSWYYCSNPPGYYPYVQNCASGWQRVQPNLPPGMY